MHLTNYSVNKNNSDYKANDEEDSLNGHKWYGNIINYLKKIISQTNFTVTYGFGFKFLYYEFLRTLKALLSYLKRQGIDTNIIWEKIKDLVVKTIIM